LNSSAVVSPNKPGCTSRPANEFFFWRIYDAH
jgi:hypothetical protein